MNTDFKSNKAKLFEEIEKIKNARTALEHEAPPACPCENTLEIRLRKFGSGQHFVWQCLKCGEQRGNPLKRNDALLTLRGKYPSEFDAAIGENWRASRLEHQKQFQTLIDREHKIHEALYGSSEISQGIKENNRRRAEVELAAKEAIDAAIKNIGSSQAILIFNQQLSHIRKFEIEHLRKLANRFKSEDELKSWFHDHFRHDFYIRKEVPGLHLAEKVNVRIDFLLQARPHLVNAGYSPELFGVEVKYFPPENDFTHKTSRGIWQTITYNDCVFETKHGHKNKVLPHIFQFIVQR